MKPHRIHVTHELVTAYDMQEKMQVLVSGLRSSEVVDLQTDLVLCSQKPKRASAETMTRFHTDEYVHFLHRVTPETAEELTYGGTRCEQLILLKPLQNAQLTTSCVCDERIVQSWLARTILRLKACPSFAPYLRVVLSVRSSLTRF